MKKILCVLLLATGFFLSSSAQNAKFALSTNTLDWANYGTANVEFGVGVAQHLSLQAGVK